MFTSWGMCFIPLFSRFLLYPDFWSINNITEWLIIVVRRQICRIVFQQRSAQKAPHHRPRKTSQWVPCYRQRSPPSDFWWVELGLCWWLLVSQGFVALVWWFDFVWMIFRYKDLYICIYLYIYIYLQVWFIKILCLQFGKHGTPPFRWWKNNMHVHVLC